MSLRFESLSRHSAEIEKVKELFRTSFPKSEQIPLWFLRMKFKQDFVDFFVFYDDNQFVGFTYLITHQQLTFILYLAIDPSLRSQGYGQKVLAGIKEKYPGNRIVLNIEAVDESSDNYQQRLKRREFYVRNGYINTGLQLIERGALYEVLVDQGEVDLEEYRYLFKKFVGAFLYRFFKPKLYTCKGI
ncbi:GNAT family N-acetyltransferase [Paenibacillus puldeungensis]|uniref:GNAT family N-acetyltransferase n=1 Tax=Paenibacillus puldeungensis TaxID=696536 RepID=A0ABW3RVF8_9BACL